MTQNTRVQLTTPSAAHADRNIYTNKHSHICCQCTTVKRHTTIQHDAEYTCSANHSVSSTLRHCTRKDRHIYTDKQTNIHICCQCTTAKDTQYNTTQNTRVQLITPSAQHSVIAHTKTKIYTQTNSHICCQCTTVKDTQYNTTQNTRVQLTTPSARHAVTAHAKTEIYTQTDKQTLAGENKHHPDSADLPALPQSTSRTVSSCL